MTPLRRSAMALLLFTLAPPARSLTLDELRRSLTELRGTAPMSVRIDSVHRRGDGKEKSESSGTVVVEDDGTSIRLVHEKKELRRQLDKKDGEGASVDAGEAFELMNYAPSLLKAMEGATLKRAVPTTFEGAPATLVEIIPAREKDEDGDKWVKSYSDTLVLWLGAGFVPLAAERTLTVKARVVIIGVEFATKDKLRFVRTAERLVVTKRTRETSSAGLGKSESTMKTATVTILK